jgi:hypothetical protein
MVMEPNTPYMFYKFLDPADAQYYQTKATPAELAALARNLNDDGYGLQHREYSYDATTDTFGKGYTAYEILYATPGKEYVIAYVGRNRVQELGEVKFTAPFKAKDLVTNNPTACQSDCKLTLTASGRTGVTIKFNYDFTKHAGVRFQYIEPVLDGAQPSADAPRETYLSFLGFGMPGDAEGLISNNWAAEPVGVDTYTLPGFEPGTKIKYAYMCEDWNGVVGELKFEEVTLPEVEDGDNPVAEVTATQSGGSVTFSFTANNQTAEMKYLVGDVNMDNDALGIKHLGNEDYYTAEEMIKKWTTYCSAQGLTTNNISTTITEPAGKTMIALCIPYSKNAIRGPLSYIIWDGQSAKTLKDYYPNYNPTAAKAAAAEHPALQSIKRPATRVVSLK